MATPAILQEGQSPPEGNSLAAPKTRTPRPDRLWIHVLLLAITFVSTTVIGMRYMDNFRHDLLPVTSDQDIFPYAWAFHHISTFYLGLPFSLTLLTILLAHEFGHYFACRRYKVRATLPYVLPAPTLSGTAGAVIRLRSRVKSREALMVIGAMGPLAGFAVALVTSLVGVALSRPLPAVADGMVHFNAPLLMRLLLRILVPGVDQQHMLWHPVYVASWIGLLITSLNLVPAGQLDGGHILYAIAPRTHRWITWLTMATLAVGGIFLWMGWLLWVGLLLLPGMRHPQVNDPVPLRKSVFALGPVCLLLFALCVVPTPIGSLSGADVFNSIITHKPLHQMNRIHIHHN
jgi:membrane-associated protease RseP (regulator of RpoE activity)